MKREKLVLNLNKETVANLNSDEMNDIKGGTQLITLRCTIIGSNCQSIITTSQPATITRMTFCDQRTCFKYCF
jgi:natural product precursor